MKDTMKKVLSVFAGIIIAAVVIFIGWIGAVSVIQKEHTEVEWKNWYSLTAEGYWFHKDIQKTVESGETIDGVELIYIDAETGEVYHIY